MMQKLSMNRSLKPTEIGHVGRVTVTENFEVKFLKFSEFWFNNFHPVQARLNLSSFYRLKAKIKKF